MYSSQKESLEKKVEEIIEFINNPDDEKIELVITNLNDLIRIQYDLNIEYQGSLYCAYSGNYFNSTNQDDIIQHEGYYFLASQVKEYYRRGKYYDLSKGDLEFDYFDGIAFCFITIELTGEFISKIFKDQAIQEIRKQEKNYENQEQPLEFICQKTKKTYYVSDRIRFNGEDVCIPWALENISLFDQAQRLYLQQYQKMSSQIITSKMY